MDKFFYKSYRRFDQLVRATMNDLASGISNVRTRAKKFWAKEANFTILQMQYTLFQCTYARSFDYDCSRCLHPLVLTLRTHLDGRGKKVCE